MIGLTRRSLLGSAALLAIPSHSLRIAAPATPVSLSPDPTGSAPISLLIQNAGPTPDHLTGADAIVAADVLLHETYLDHGQRVMRQVKDIVIPAQSVISLEPGASHLMLHGLRQSLVQGDLFSLTLHFAEAGDVSLEVRVRRKQDAAGVPQTSPVGIGPLTILHASAPPAPMAHG